MNEPSRAAQSAYEVMVEDLKKFREESTELDVSIYSGHYPIRIQFTPVAQVSVFGDENIDENGEINELTITVGLTTSVRSTLRFKMNAGLLKKLIRKSERVGEAYYHAFREAADGFSDKREEEAV